MNIITKEFKNSKIRTIIINGEPWFIAKDVLEILLDNKNPNVGQATKDLEDDELTSFKIMSGGQVREMAIVSESGLYSLILKSRKHIAKPFQKWVTRDVLPSIRNTGSYQIQPKDDISELENSLQVTKIASQFLDIFHKKNKLQLLYLDNFVKSETGNSIIEKFGIDLKNQFFLPTELGNFIGKSGMEINQIFANFGFQEKINGVWKLLERGQEFGSVFQNGSNLQIKWKLSVLEKI